MQERQEDFLTAPQRSGDRQTKFARRARAPSQLTKLTKFTEWQGRELLWEGLPLPCSPPARCALRAICDALPSHFPVLRLAWPIFQPRSGVAYRYLDSFRQKQGVNELPKIVEHSFVQAVPLKDTSCNPVNPVILSSCLKNSFRVEW